MALFEYRPLNVTPETAFGRSAIEPCAVEFYKAETSVWLISTVSVVLILKRRTCPML